MSKVVLEITMSVDGFVAGEEVSGEHPMGKHGEDLHEWMFSEQSDENALTREMGDYGAVILGNTTYRIGIETGWGGKSPFVAPAFVLCSRAPTEAVDGFIYVKEGIEYSLDSARSAAGNKDIWIMGGADVARQYLSAGFIDEIKLHIAPILLGGGTRLFGDGNNEPVRLNKLLTTETENAVHVNFKVGGNG